MTKRALLVTVVLAIALAALPRTAPAQVPGEEQGVTVVRGSDGYVLRFGKRAARVYRRIAGRRVEAGCARLAPVLGGFSVDSDSGSSLRAPRRHRRLRTFTRGSFDFCFVRFEGSDEDLIAAAPLTDDGRTYLDEVRTVALLLLPYNLFDDTTRPVPTTEMVAKTRGAVVALDGPDGSPPRGKVGYWTDGVRVVTAAVTRKGRRLFFEIERDVVRTNAFPYLTDG